MFGVTQHIGFMAKTPVSGVDYDMDELHITKGVARYTADFTPPTAPFPNS